MFGIPKYDTLFILYQKKIIFRIKLKAAEDSLRGEVDIVIDSGGNAFRKGIIQLPDRQRCVEADISSCSWHGYYKRQEDQIKKPVIHFKSGRNYLLRFEHAGTITHEKVFLFPVCSVYVPEDYGRLCHKPAVPEDPKKIFDVPYLPIRIDLFVLPKGMEKDDFVRLTAFTFYQQDIIFFTHQFNCAYLGDPGRPFEFVWARLNDWHVALRYCRKDGQVYPEQYAPGYSIYLFDTFNPHETLYNRGIAYGIDEVVPEQFKLLPEYGQTGKIMFKYVHEHELNDLKLRKQIHNL